jgi:hypothetical protein
LLASIHPLARKKHSSHETDVRPQVRARSSHGRPLSFSPPTPGQHSTVTTGTNCSRSPKPERKSLLLRSNLAAAAAALPLIYPWPQRKNSAKRELRRPDGSLLVTCPIPPPPRLAGAGERRKAQPQREEEEKLELEDEDCCARATDLSLQARSQQRRHTSAAVGQPHRTSDASSRDASARRVFAVNRHHRQLTMAPPPHPPLAASSARAGARVPPRRRRQFTSAVATPYRLAGRRASLRKLPAGALTSVRDLEGRRKRPGGPEWQADSQPPARADAGCAP